MQKIKDVLSVVVSRVSNRALHTAASLMVIIGGSAVALSAVPFWHNEPEMPQSMLDEIVRG